jgi:hypothetical protein
MLRPLVLLSLIAAAGLPVLAWSATDTKLVTTEPTILPGYWETENKVLSPKASDKVERKCLKPDQIEKFLTQGPNNKNYVCTYPTQEIHDGHLLLKGSCADKHGLSFKIAGQGTYTLSELHVTANARPAIIGIPIPIVYKAELDAHRLADVCPPDAKPF